LVFWKTIFPVEYIQDSGDFKQTLGKEWAGIGIRMAICPKAGKWPFNLLPARQD